MGFYMIAFLLEQDHASDLVPEWDESMAIGHTLIDAQHKWLFALAKEALQPDVEKARGVILKLYRYTQVHFAKEEAMMKEADYPLLPEHVEQHEFLLDKVCAMSESMTTDPSVLEELPALLARWLKDHIHCYDRACAPFVKMSKSEAFYCGNCQRMRL